MSSLLRVFRSSRAWKREAKIPFCGQTFPRGIGRTWGEDPCRASQPPLPGHTEAASHLYANATFWPYNAWHLNCTVPAFTARSTYRASDLARTVLAEVTSSGAVLIQARWGSDPVSADYSKGSGRDCPTLLLICLAVLFWLLLTETLKFIFFNCQEEVILFQDWYYDLAHGCCDTLQALMHLEILQWKHVSAVHVHSNTSYRTYQTQENSL